PLSHVDVRIFDNNDQELAPGAVGEIVIRGPNVMKGYLNLPGETARAMRGGWYHTGDAGQMDDEGFLWISGRKKEMIISGGENIYPVEVENVLSLHPAVGEVAVIGIPHEKWGEAVHAVVVFADGASLSESELISFCKERLAAYKCPRSLTIRSERLPISGANKILKSKLLQEYLEG
ncbi:MAG: class I adenylate-forming enzyme family protein, partial [Hyphomicrobiales bacterium]